jgi:hypothetical protein
MALLLSSVFGVTGCGSDDDVDVESRVKNVLSRVNTGNSGFGKKAGLPSGRLTRDDKLDLMRDHVHFHKHPYDMVHDEIDDDIKDEIKINLDLKDDTLKSLLDTGHHVGVDKSETGGTYGDHRDKNPVRG